MDEVSGTAPEQDELVAVPTLRGRVRVLDGYLPLKPQTMLSEEEMADAIKFAHEAIKVQIAAQ